MRDINGQAAEVHDDACVPESVLTLNVVAAGGACRGNQKCNSVTGLHQRCELLGTGTAWQATQSRYQHSETGSFW